MGTFSLKNYDRDYGGITSRSLFDLEPYNNFYVKISNIMVSHSTSINGWLKGSNKATTTTTAVIDRFGYEFVLSLPKDPSNQ
jgi:hypothetical protein